VSSITTDQGIVHYEVYGRGKPVILLHGWLGSWGLWQDTMSFLGRYYRTYAMDFWGFGESGKKRETYAVQDFVSLVDQFMEQLGITKAPLVGHSMGGTVSLSVAIRYPERVSKVVVVGSPMVGTSLAPLLKLAGYRPTAFFLFNLMGPFRAWMKLCPDLFRSAFPDDGPRPFAYNPESFPFDCSSPHRPAPHARSVKCSVMEFMVTVKSSTRRNGNRCKGRHAHRAVRLGIFPCWKNPQNFGAVKIL
jgi:pimeloyl-ACP methyl ester carboxylesterase